MDSAGRGDWRRLSGSREGRRRRAGEDEVRLVHGVGARVRRVHVRGMGVCVRVRLRVRQGKRGLADAAPSGRVCGLCVKQRKLWMRGEWGVRRKGGREAGAHVGHAPVATLQSMLGDRLVWAVRGGVGVRPSRQGDPLKSMETLLPRRGYGLRMEAMMVVVRGRRLPTDTVAGSVAVLGVQGLDLGRPPALCRAQRRRGQRWWPSCSRWGHRGGVGWPRGDNRTRCFGSLAPKQGAQEGSSVVAVAPGPHSSRSSLGAAGDWPSASHYRCVLLPRPTPHPHSGAQDGALRPEVFCSIASREHSGYWVTLVRPRTANDGTLIQTGPSVKS